MILVFLSSGNCVKSSKTHADFTTLKGKYAEHRECHIKPDWLLVYKIEKDKLLLVLTNTGTHSDLF
jgi:mRNA interferase YafQ